MSTESTPSSSGQPSQSTDQTATPAVTNVSGDKPVFPSNATVRVGLEVKAEKAVKKK